MDIEHIKALIAAMGEHALTEVIVREGDSRVVLRRGPIGGHAPIAAQAAAAQFMPAPAMPGLANGQPAVPVAAAAPATPAKEVKAPMVGTFYASPEPEAPAFVKIGSNVDPDSVVCIIEAMKVFNEIKAECSGVVERILVTNGSPVEFGQALFVVRPH